MSNADAKPVKRSRGLWVGLCLVIILVLAVLFEPTQIVMGTLGGDEFFDGLPTRRWAHLMSAGPAERDAAMLKIQQGGKAAVLVLTQILEDTAVDPEVRCIVAEQLAKIGPDAATAGKAMLAGMRDADPHVRAVCMAHLSDVGVPAETAVPLLVETLKSDPTVVCVRTLSNYRAAAAPAVPILIDILKDHSRETELRSNASRTLGKIGPDARSATPLLIAELGDADASVREHCAESLGQIGSDADQAIPALIPVLNDSNLRVRRDAVRSLGQFGNAARPALDGIRKLLKDPEEMVREAAKTAFKAVAPDEPLPVDKVEAPKKESDAKPKTEAP